jgi:8-amino-7-oxononanoate synthase
MENIYNKYIEQLETIKENNLLRSLKTITSRSGKFIVFNNKKCLNLSSNDYLGLATDAELTREFYSGLTRNNLIEEYGLGASSSRLLCGNINLYEKLEQTICQIYESEAALVFNSGYHANIGIIPALTEKGDLILSDSLNHASIVDGIRLSKAEYKIYRHNDISHLTGILEKCRNRYERAIIVTESVFSMDGDLSDLKKLVSVKTKFNALLYVDEAHSAGVYGENGAGLCVQNNVSKQVDIILGTFGKALASHGAYAVTNNIIKDVLVNKMRSLLYTTALPPVVMNWNLFIMGKIQSLQNHRKRLQDLSEQFRNSLQNKNLHFIGKSHIIPIVTYDNKTALALAGKLFDKGFLTFPIRWPTVPSGNSRIRITLSSNINFDDIKDLARIISCEIKTKQEH